MKIAANAQHFRSNSQSRQEKFVVRKSEKRIGDSNRALNCHTADHAREAGARIRTASLMLCALSLTLPATSAQQPCTLRETTVACADNKAVFDILNDGIYPDLDCTAWEMMEDVFHLGVDGLVEWEQACAEMPQDESEITRPAKDFETSVDVVSCKVSPTATVTLASWTEVGKMSQHHLLTECRQERLQVRGKLLQVQQHGAYRRM